MGDLVKEILRVVSSSLQIPTIVILILLILLTIVMLGSFVAEIFTERRALKMNIPGLVDQLQGKGTTGMKEAIEASGLLNRQKEACRELINRVSYSDDTREALARQLIADEEIRYGKIVKITDLVSRVAPMFGLMGTLIPLGPGLIALGQGDTSTLSSSLLIAFDTTVAGLISGAISYVISGVRKNWYEEYMIGLETIMETILDVQSTEREKTGEELKNGQQARPAGAKATPAGAKAGAPRQGGKPQQGGRPPQQQGRPQQGRPQQPARRPAPQGAGAAPQGARPAAPQGAGAAAPRQAAQGRSAAPQPAGGLVSKRTQTQAPRNSKTDQTMVQRTFQEEVRAAEQAMMEGRMSSERR